MLSINTNLSSLITQNSLKNSTSILNQAVERMTTGYKINHAKDNAANYSISTNMTTKIGSYMVAEDNCLQGLDFLTTASDSLSLIEDKLNRLRALGELAANDTYGEQSVNALNQEFKVITDEVNRIYKTADYNGVKLFKQEANYDMADYSGVDRSKLPQVGSNGFIKEIIKRDTSTMTKLADVDEGVDLADGTYSISTPEELAKLSRMVKAGLVTRNDEFVLANDIDLSAYSTGEGWVPIGFGDPWTKDYAFKGTFDGNGYIVSNLYINRHGYYFRIGVQGLFGQVEGTIKNLGVVNANVSADEYTGAICGAKNSYTTISNCYVKNSKISGTASVGAIVGYTYGYIEDCYAIADVTGTLSEVALLAGELYNGSLKNSFSEGSVSGNGDYVGGLIGNAQYTEIENCYSKSTVINISSTSRGTGGIAGGQCSSFNNCYFEGSVKSAGLNVGGICGALQPVHYNKASSYNAYSTGYIEGNDGVGGIVGYLGQYCPTLENCSTMAEVKGITNVGAIAGVATASTIIKNGYYQNNKNSLSLDGSGLAQIEAVSELPYIELFLDFQVGVSSSVESQIEISVSFDMVELESLMEMDLKDNNYLETVDTLLKRVSLKQTEYGAVQNRLESVLDEISIQYDNLVSSRSTIRDADIAEVSSHYIQQQILQQASSTLLATANQSPSIALQLI